MVTVSAAPALAAGGWQAGGGTPEPSTEYDAAEYMFQEPNREAVDRIYYNGFQINGWVAMADGNLEGGTTASHLYRFGAYLGFWRDCNGDGFIGAKTVPEAYAASYGHFSNGAYPAGVFPVDTTVCPRDSPYNQGNFIDEFRWIGPNASYTNAELQEFEEDRCSAENAVTVGEDFLESEIHDDCLGMYRDLHDVTDSGAVAWLDLSRPEAPAATTRPILAKELFDDSSSTLDLVGFYGLHGAVEGRAVDHPDADQDGQPDNGTRVDDETTVHYPDLDGDGEPDRAFTPVPTGTWDGQPSFGDCGDAGRGEREFGGGPTMNAWGTDTGVSTCGYYPLWQAKRLVNDSESEHDEGAQPLVQVYDTETDDDNSGSACDDTTLPGGLSMADFDPSVRADDPLMEGSLGGTVWRNVFYSTNLLHATNTTNPAFSGQCDEEAYPPAALASTSAAEGKFIVDTFLVYYPDTRHRNVRDFGTDNVPADGLGLVHGPASPAGESRWLSAHVYVRALAHQTLTQPYWMTFYADVTHEAFEHSGARPETAFPNSRQNAHEYGRTECNGNYDDTPENRQMNSFGWICSAAVWDAEAKEFNGNNAPDGIDNRLRVIVGHPFDLRDADCYDDTLFHSDTVSTRTGDVYVESADGSGAREDYRITCHEDGLVNDHVVDRLNASD